MKLEGEARAGFLERECPGDDSLREEVESLLRHHVPLREAASSAVLGTGTLLADRYRVLERIGHGGMGEVFRVEDTALGVTVALKRVRDPGPEHRDRLLEEVRLAREVTHPAVGRVYDVGQVGDELFLTMEYVDGGDLSDLLKRVGPLSPERVRRIGARLCAGLQAAHDRGVLHRDLKPANILLDAEGEPRIVDFGIATTREHGGSGALVGTPAYMAPEQLVFDAEVSERTDLYALGLVLHELLTGEATFRAQTAAALSELQRFADPEKPSRRAPGVPRDLEAAILQALAKDPAARPASAAALAELLEGNADAATETRPGSLTSTSEHLGRRARRPLTVWCVELRNSDALASDLELEALDERVRGALARCEAVVARYGGSVAEPQAEGFIAYFGHPAALEDAPERALRAACEVREAFGQDFDAQAPMAVAVAVHTGPALIEEGPGRPRTFGPTLTIARRLLQSAPAGSVVATEAVLATCGDGFEVRPRPDSAQVSTFEVLSPREGTPAHRHALVGRTQELALLEDRFEQVLEGVGQVVLVTGEAGVGKSRLVAELRARLGTAPRFVAECRNRSFSQQSPLHSLVELVREQLSLREARDPKHAYEILRAGVSRSGLADAEDALPLVAQLLRIPLPGGEPSETLAPEQVSRRTKDLLVRWALALGAPGPAVLVVEDLHFADPSSLEVVEGLVQEIPTSRLLLVLSARPGMQLDWLGREHVTPVALRRMRKSEVRRMMEGRLGSDVRAEAVDRVFTRADGNPLFVGELIRCFESLEGASGESIPASLQDLLMARLDGLGRGKVLAQLASVLGRDFSTPQLRALADGDPAAVDHHLAGLVEAEILTRRADAHGGTAYAFRHALIEEAAYESIPAPERRSLHGQVCALLRERFAPELSEHPEWLAHHAERAGRLEEALEAWVEAGAAAQQVCAYREARHHFERALAAVDGLPPGVVDREREVIILSGLGYALSATLGWGSEAARGVFHRAHEACLSLDPKTPSRLSTLVALLGSYRTAGALDAETRADALLEAAERAGDRRVALYARAGQGEIALWKGELDRCRPLLEGVLEDWRTHGVKPLEVYPEDLEVVAHEYLALVEWLSGRRAEADRHARCALATAERSSEALNRALAGTFIAALHLLRRSREDALALARPTEASSRDHGILFLEKVASAQGACADAFSRQPAALDRAARTVAEARAAGAVLYVDLLLSHLAESQLQAGRVEEALQSVDAGLEITSGTLSRLGEPELLRLQGAARLRLDAGDAAGVEALERALALAEARGARAFGLRAAIDLARWHVDAGRPAEARRLIERSLDGWPEEPDPLDGRVARALLERSP